MRVRAERQPLRLKVGPRRRRLRPQVWRKRKSIEAQGLAEAAAILKKAEAWKEFNEAARLQTILEKLPAIIQASTGVFGAVAAPLGNIDKVVMIDQGGGNGQGPSGMNRFASTAPSVIFALLQQLEALGINVPSMLKQLGVQPAVEVTPNLTTTGEKE